MVKFAFNFFNFFLSGNDIPRSVKIPSKSRKILKTTCTREKSQKKIFFYFFCFLSKISRPVFFKKNFGPRENAEQLLRLLSVVLVVYPRRIRQRKYDLVIFYCDLAQTSPAT